jgi:hypothetical protein
MPAHLSRSVFPPLLTLALTLLAGAISYAGGGLCDQCGCDGCNKVCRLVREDRKITVNCWAMKKEKFCLGGPSCPGCEHCEMVCDEKTGDPKAPCAEAKRMVWIDWIPNCHARMFTKNKLMKKTVTKTVPGFKWVVEDLCGECKSKVQAAEIPPGADVPPPPVRAANVEQIPMKW